MDELEELTDGKDINELYHQLAHQLNNGEPIAGSICSHIMEVLNQRHTVRLTKRYWRSTGNPPPKNIEVLLYYGKGLIVSGRFFYFRGDKDKPVYASESKEICVLPTHWTELGTLAIV